LFLLDTSAIRRRVARLPQVAHVAVAASWPHRVVIRITERHPAAVAETPAGEVLLDGRGVAFATVATASAGLGPVPRGDGVPGPHRRPGPTVRVSLRVDITITVYLRVRVRQRIPRRRWRAPESDPVPRQSVAASLGHRPRGLPRHRFAGDARPRADRPDPPKR